MDYVLDEVVPSDELRKFEKVYHDQLDKFGKADAKAQFEYAWCLVRSKYSSDISKGISLLRELCRDESDDGKRDYMFYLAIGTAKLKDYSTSLKYLDILLSVEPNNTQVKDLKSVVKRRMEKEGLMGIAIVGGAALAVGALVGIGVAIAKKH